MGSESLNTQYSYTASLNVKRFTPWQLICYGALSMPIAMGGMALFSFLPTYFAVDLGLGLSMVGAVFVVGRLLDVVTDPLIGLLSDKTRTRCGARRPWMLLTFPFYALVLWGLFVPFTEPGLVYALVFSSLYFIFYTALDVPYSAVGLEISPYVHERSVLASSKSIFQILGAISASLIPLAFVGNMAGALKVTAFSVIVLGLVGLVLFFTFVPKRYAAKPARQIALRDVIKLGFSNPVYKFMLLAFALVQTANALTAGLVVLYATHILKLPDIAGVILGVMFVASALFLPLWIYMSKRFSKSGTWQIALLVGAAALFASIGVGENDVIYIFICSLVLGATFGCDAIMPTSILADIVNKDDAAHDVSTGGLYLAIKNAVSKLTFIAPMGIAFPVLDAVGLTAGDLASGNSSSWVLIGFFALLPCILRIFSYFAARQMAKRIEVLQNAS